MDSTVNPQYYKEIIKLRTFYFKQFSVTAFLFFGREGGREGSHVLILSIKTVFSIFAFFFSIIRKVRKKKQKRCTSNNIYSILT